VDCCWKLHTFLLKFTLGEGHCIQNIVFGSVIDSLVDFRKVSCTSMNATGPTAIEGYDDRPGDDI